MLPRPPGPPLHPRWCQSAGGCGRTLLQEGGGGGEGRRGRPFQEASEGRRSTSMRQQALHVLELHRSTPRPPPRGGGGPFTFTFLSGGELPTSAGGARGGAPGGGASMGSHDVFLTSLQDSAYEGFAKFDSNSGTSQVRAPPRPARPRRHPSLEGASQQASREEGAGGRAGAWDEAACPPASWGNEGTRGRTLSLSLSLASSRRSRAAGAPGRVLLSRTGLGRPGCHGRGPLLRPGGRPGDVPPGPSPRPQRGGDGGPVARPTARSRQDSRGRTGSGEEVGGCCCPIPPTSSLPAPAPAPAFAPAGPRRRAGPAADAAAAGTRSPRCCCRSRRRCSTSRRSWTRRSWTSSSGC